MIKAIALNDELAEVLVRLSTHTGLAIDAITNRILSGHLAELHELDAFLDTHVTESESQYQEGQNLLQSYGPESILEGIMRIAPDYETLSARFSRITGLPSPVLPAHRK